MSTAWAPGAALATPQRWWRESEVALLVLLVFAAYFVRIGDVSMRGEEPTRAHVAFAMLDSGDWIVPRVLGKPFLSRPPLQNWLIAASTTLCGSREPWAVRLPSALAMLATTLLLYSYARTCLSRVGALAAAASFPTFAEMFTTGCQAETDMVFTALVSASLILWHWGETAGWPARRGWVAGYVCVALAILCKGPQPPVYFVGAVGAYLICMGQWRRLFTRAHVTGLLVCALIVLAWLVPCVNEVGATQTWLILMNDSAMRFRKWVPGEVVEHLVQFPLEVLGCTLPWSLLLVGFLNRDLRQRLAQARPHALFMALCVSLAFPTIWLPPNGQTRYFTPLYPCLAMLIGIIVEQCVQADAALALKKGWQRFGRLWAGVMVAVPLAIVLAALCLHHHPTHAAWCESLSVALGYAAVGVALAVVTYRNCQGGAAPRARTLILALSCFMVLVCAGFLTNVRIRRSVDQPAAVARLHEQLPRGQRLVCFGNVDLLFAYYFGDAIERHEIPTSEDEAGSDDNAYFCFDRLEGSQPALPFAWKEVAVISMDRNQKPSREREVVVGLRVPKAPRIEESVPIVPVSTPSQELRLPRREL